MYDTRPGHDSPAGLSGAPAQGNKTPEVQLAVQSLEQVTNRIDVELKGLIERIVPIMATHPVANTAETKSRSYSAPLAVEIGINVERLHEILRLITLAHGALEV